MISFLGYNFYADRNCTDPMPTIIEKIDYVKISSAIYNHLNITEDTTVECAPAIKPNWSFSTIFDAPFNGNMNAGNVDEVYKFVDEVLLRRRTIDLYTGQLGEWITLNRYKVDNPEDFDFIYQDNLIKHGVIYQYAFVPATAGTLGNYVMGKIETYLKGVFLCDKDVIYKFSTEVEYSNALQNVDVQEFRTLGSKYPTIVQNNVVNYFSGTVTMLYVTEATLNNEESRALEVAARNRLLAYINNGKAKVLKDWNGNFWLMHVNSASTLEYQKFTGMALAKISVNFSEIGDGHSEESLYESEVLY